MDLFLARVRRLWNTWDLRILVLLSLSLQIILTLLGNRRRSISSVTLLGNRRRSISSLWISVFVWLAYLMADWAATVALGKLSDTQVNYGNGKSLRAIWAPLLLLHLGGPDTITAYSLEDNHLWMRHFFELVVQFSVAVYVILMSWTHSWFLTMSIPALVAGFVKYGERTYVLWSVTHDISADTVPFGNLGGEPNLGSNNTLEDSIRVLCIAHECLKKFKRYMLSYDVQHRRFSDNNRGYLDDINLFWKAIEVEMGLMFDLFYTKVPINFRKGGWILRCITFVCTITVLLGSTFELISTREDRNQWHKVDIAITEVLVVGALALEIYAVIALYLFSDWAMLWLIKHKYNRAGKQVIQLRRKFSWLFLPKQYRCNMMGQVNLIEYCLKSFGAEKTLFKRILRSLPEIDHSKYRRDKYVHKTAVVVNSLLLYPILDCCRRLGSDGRIIRDDSTRFSDKKALEDQILELHPHTSDGRIIRDDSTRFSDEEALEDQILKLHLHTEVCYNLEMDWDTHDDDASNSSSSWKENKELCRTLSQYMTYIVIMRPSMLPSAALDKEILAQINKQVQEIISSFPTDLIDELKARGEATLDVRAALLLLDREGSFTNAVPTPLRIAKKDERWEMLKSAWVKMLCETAIKCHRYEHLRQLSQGGEFLTFLWFFIPQSEILTDNQVLPHNLS